MFIVRLKGDFISMSDAEEKILIKYEKRKYTTCLPVNIFNSCTTIQKKPMMHVNLCQTAPHILIASQATTVESFNDFKQHILKEPGNKA